MIDESKASCAIRAQLEQDRKTLFKAWMAWHSSNNAANGYPSASQLRKRRLEAQAALDQKNEEIARHVQDCAGCRASTSDSQA